MPVVEIVVFKCNVCGEEFLSGEACKCAYDKRDWHTTGEKRKVEQ